MDSVFKSVTLVAHPLEPVEPDGMVLALGYSLIRCPFCPHSRQRPWLI